LKRAAKRATSVVFNLLSHFPSDDVDGQILQQVKAKLEQYNTLNEQGQVHR